MIFPRCKCKKAGYPEISSLLVSVKPESLELFLFNSGIYPLLFLTKIDIRYFLFTRSLSLVGIYALDILLDPKSTAPVNTSPALFAFRDNRFSIIFMSSSFKRWAKTASRDFFVYDIIILSRDMA